MEDNIVVISSLGKSREVLASLGRMVVVQLDNNGTLRDVSGFCALFW